MTNHPITPPPGLVQQWVDQLLPQGSMKAFNVAAQWGANQELEACCEWLKGTSELGLDLELIRTRRPKPPSLKEQALAALDDAIMRGDCITISDALPTIRRALEALPDD